MAAFAKPALDFDFFIGLGALQLALAMKTQAQALALVGPSGSGKSTCLRVLAGLEPRARGRIAVAEEVWQDSGRGIHLPAWRRRVGWVPQDAALFPHLDVRGNLGFARTAKADLELIAELLEITPLLRRLPRNLSGGERQRVALGRALLSNPRLLLLDEPFNALDKALRARIGHRVFRLCREWGLPAVLVSHDSGDFASFADEVWDLGAGAERNTAAKRPNAENVFRFH